MQLVTRFITLPSQLFIKQSLRRHSSAAVLKGEVKETVGELTDNQTLKYKGKAEKIAGKVQARYGDAKQNLNKDR